MKYDWFEMNEADVKAYRALCPPGEYRCVQPSLLPRPLPTALTRKYDSVVVAASGLGTPNVVCYMLNGHRIDAKANAVDQQPFGFVSSGDAPITSGCLIQHGNWPDRTTKPPPEFWHYISGSGIGNCYPLKVLPAAKSGLIGEIEVVSQRDAFQALLDEIRRSLATVSH